MRLPEETRRLVRDLYIASSGNKKDFYNMLRDNYHPPEEILRYGRDIYRTPFSAFAYIDDIPEGIWIELSRDTLEPLVRSLPIKPRIPSYLSLVKVRRVGDMCQIINVKPKPSSDEIIAFGYRKSDIKPWLSVEERPTSQFSVEEKLLSDILDQGGLGKPSARYTNEKALKRLRETATYKK